MIPHHASAIPMCEKVKEPGDSGAVRRHLSSQKAEIKQMKNLLSKEG